MHSIESSPETSVLYTRLSCACYRAFDVGGSVLLKHTLYIFYVCARTISYTSIMGKHACSLATETDLGRGDRDEFDNRRGRATWIRPTFPLGARPPFLLCFGSASYNPCQANAVGRTVEN